MENNGENLDSLNETEAGQETSEPTEDVVALKQKIEDLSGKNRQLFERAKKAEGFEKNSDGHWIKSTPPEPKPEVKEVSPQSNEPDYAKLAFLEGKGIQHPDDQKLVQDEATRLKLPLTDILGMEYIKSKLKTA